MKLGIERLRALCALIAIGAAWAWHSPAIADPATQAVKPDGTGVPVRTVVLFSSGVGYFEHFGTVNGSGTTELRFKTRQINDILKSLILQDLDGGKVTAISYPSQDPIEKTLKSFQVDITHNPSLGELLNQLRGAKVKVFLNGESIAGTVLGIERKEKSGKDDQKSEAWVLNLFTGLGVKAVNLESVTNIDFDDAQLRAELGKALGALSEARDQDKKPVTISFTGDKERRVRLGYVVETPIWKTSYRLILTEGAKAQAALQGWAIVENQTDNDWNDVQLSLVSGRPISFIQDLYQPLYVPRPVLKPKLFASLRPQTYEGGLTEEQEKQRAEEDARAKEQAEAAGLMKPRRRGSGGGAGGGGGLFGGGGGKARGEEPFDPTASVSSLASANKVGELFQYTVGNVTLPRQRSAMIPIITDPLELERLSIYNETVLERNPLYGARIRNTTKKHLLSGPITVIDAGSYAGDANIDDLPPGQERFVSYGVDLDVLVHAEEAADFDAVQSAKIIKGVMVVTRKLRTSETYDCQNKGEKNKTLVIEHYFQEGWDLIDTEKPFEKTEAVYRFKQQLPAGKRAKLIVREQIVTDQRIELLSRPDSEVEWCLKERAISKQVQEAVAEVMRMKAAQADTAAQIDQRQQQANQIATEQNRIRENMKTVNQQQSEYYTRLLKKLNDQESEIEKLQAEAEELRKKGQGQKKELEKYLSELSVE